MVTLHFYSIDKTFIRNQRQQWIEALKHAQADTLVTKIEECLTGDVAFYEFDVMFNIAEARNCPGYMLIDGKKSMQLSSVQS